jgi:hypothetical protein
MEKYAALFAIVPVLFVIVNLASAALSTHRAANKQVMTEGLLGTANVLGYDRIGRTNYVDYSFTPKGRDSSIVCRRQFIRVPVFSFEKFETGTQVPVRYLEKYPTISLLVPYAKYQCAT